MSREIFTIGHSNIALDEFINLLKQYNITAIADVRSSPYSSYCEHFSHNILSKAMKESDIAYVFLGKELGGRPNNINCYVNNKADYEKISSTCIFQYGIERITNGMNKYKIALICAEKDPINCHRMLLVSKYLKSKNIEIKNILIDGNIETLEESEDRLLKETKSNTLQEAYKKQSKKIAYKK